MNAIEEADLKLREHLLTVSDQSGKLLGRAQNGLSRLVHLGLSFSKALQVRNHGGIVEKL